MATLLDYAETHFPNHVTEATSDDLALTSHTAVAHVIGTDRAALMERAVRTKLPNASVGVVLVRPTTPTVIPTRGEDREGVADLPKRRIATAGIIGGVLVGAIIGVVVGLLTESPAAAVIVGIFAAVLGGASAAMVGGGARYGGERAWEQSNQPNTTVALVAAFMREEADASTAASVMESLDPHDVRILSEDGAWHSPHT